MTAQVNRTSLFASAALALIGVVQLLAGAALFSTHLPIAGYGIWIFVWGLAFLIGALSRFTEGRAWQSTGAR